MPPVDGEPVAAAAAGGRAPASLPTLSGRWRKDEAASDSMEAACNMVQLPWLYRLAIKILRVMVLEDSEGFFKSVMKAGGLMDVVEEYPWSGEEVVHARRDKRRGSHRGRVTRTERGPCISVRWDEPYAGEGTDTFELSPDGNTLTQHTTMVSAATGQCIHYKTVFRRIK